MSKQIHDESRRESGRNTQVRVRVDKNLLDAYDEWVDESDEFDSRSEALRSAMRQSIGDIRSDRTPREPPHDDEMLHVAYLKLCDIANADGVVSHDLAEQELATTLGKRAGTVRRRILGDLRDRGYLCQAANVYGDRSYKIRGWSA